MLLFGKMWCPKYCLQHLIKIDNEVPVQIVCISYILFLVVYGSYFYDSILKHFLTTEMFQAFSTSSTPAVEVCALSTLYNVKDWIIPHMFRRFGNHSKPHWFQFLKVEGVTRMQYRMFAEDPWLPNGGPAEGLICLRVG